MEFLFSKHFLHKTILIAKSSYLRMSTQLLKTVDTTYKEAVTLLNSLQPLVSQYSQLNGEKMRGLIVPETIRNLSRLGIERDELNKLNVIHVSGTKGKGSTCAFSESILRHKGYRTGFLSSPHIVEVRERIRLNGKPISKQKFTEYFLTCYETFSKYPKEEMPNYVRFLTVMSYLVFLREEVDVAVVEVGLGGEYDSTNAIMKPTVCGVSSLGYDHTDLLGDTMASIAWNKAGIFKAGTPAVTVPQCEEAMSVLVARAREKRIPLYLCSPLPIPQSSLGIQGQVQVLNASLALQLTAIWLQRHSKDTCGSDTTARSSPHLPIDCPSISLTPDLLLGLSNCSWPGRCQTVKSPGVTFYLDGAHTQESMREASTWFYGECLKEAAAHKGRVVRVLLFAVTGYRDASALLKELLMLNFDYALFTPPITSSVRQTSEDVKKKMLSIKSMLRRCIDSKQLWQNCLKQAGDQAAEECTNNSQKQNPKSDFYETISEDLPPIELPSHPISHPLPAPGTISYVMPSIQDSLVWLCSNRDARLRYTPEEAARAGFKFAFESAGHVVNGSSEQVGSEDLLVQVVCTGSLYLVGGVLSFLGPPGD